MPREKLAVVIQRWRRRSAGWWTWRARTDPQEGRLPEGAHSGQDFDINGVYPLLAVKLEWFSVSMLILMESVSLLDTLAQAGNNVELARREHGMNLIGERARGCTESIPEARALRLWRDKVAAYRSGNVTPPRGADDSLTTRLVSLPGEQVMTKNGRYVAPAVIPIEGGESPSVHDLEEWSLTETWERLERNRYRWLDNGSFLDPVRSHQLGPSASVGSLSLRELTPQEREEMKAVGLPVNLWPPGADKR